MKLEDFLIAEEGDDSKRLPDGRYTATWDSIGKCFNIGPGLTKGVTKDTVWTAEQLKAAEDAEFAATRAAVAKLVKVPLGENRTTALESLVYNIGEAGFAHSTVLRRVNAGDFDNVPAAFRMWNKAHGVVIRGLVKRREDEISLWLHPDGIPLPANFKTSKNVPPASFLSPQATIPTEKPMALSDLFSGFVSAVASIVNSPILGSFGRKVGAAVATALIGKYGIDQHSIESIIGGIAAIWTVASSIKAHLPSGSSASSALSDAAAAAAHAAVTAAIPAILAQVAPAPAANAIEPQPASE